jgi:glycosyltransferase involved in cell wall biosynthesis
MNVLFVTPTHARFHIGGLGESCARISTGLAAAGHRVTVAVFPYGDVMRRPSGVPSAPTSCSDRAVNVEYFPDGDTVAGARPPFGQQVAFNLQQVFLRLNLLADKHGKPDIIVAFFPMPLGLPASLAAATRGIPLIAAFRGNDIGLFSHDPAWLPILQQVLRVASASVFVAGDLRDLALAIAPGMRNPRIIYNGIDPLVSGRAWRRPAADAPVFGSVGIFTPKKGIEVFLRAVERLGLGERTRLVGDFAKSSSRRESFSVQMTGVVPREVVLRYLEEIDVFVVPSTSEGCPNAALEAMAAGKTIVSSRVGALQDLLRNNESGWLLDGWSDEEMCNALTTLDGDAALRHRLGEGARAVARTLTTEREIAEWNGVLRQ